MTRVQPIARLLVTVFAAVLAAVLIAGFPVAHAADRYPSRTVKLVVAFAPGGVADVLAASLANALERVVGKLTCHPGRI